MNKKIEEMNGISKNQALKLKKEGILSQIELALTPSKLLEKFGINKEQSLSDVSPKIKTALKIFQNNFKFISTGSRNLDALLGGGVQNGFVTDFFGQRGTGKTQICFQLCINAQILSNFQRTTIFVDSLNTFRPERISEIARNIGIQEDKILEKILVVNARSVFTQSNTIFNPQITPKSKINLLIVDDFIENFFFDYQDQDKLIERQSNLSRYLHDLCSLAIDQNIAVVVTNSVRSRSGIESFSEVETGGNAVSQGVHIRIHLSHEHNNIRASLVQPFINKSPINFFIGKKGIRDD
jgi:DNA repair protein RadA